MLRPNHITAEKSRKDDFISYGLQGGQVYGVSGM